MRFLQIIISNAKCSWWCLQEAIRPGQSMSYRIWRLKEALGINPETN